MVLSYFAEVKIAVVAERLKYRVVTEEDPLVARPQFLRHLRLVGQAAMPDRIGTPHVFEEWIGAGLTGEVEGDGLAVKSCSVLQRHQPPP